MFVQVVINKPSIDLLIIANMHDEGHIHTYVSPT